MISVIIPVLNEAETIEPFLRHLQPFRDAGHEVIVVDGGSSDGTPEKSVSYADRILITSAGRAHQMNAGANAANGQLFLFQHVDTFLPKTAEALLDAVSNADSFIWGRFDVRLARGHWMFPVIATLMNWRSRFTQIATGDQSIFISRSLFDEVGGFPNQPLMEDIEISSQLRMLSAPVCLKDKVTTSSRRWLVHGVWKTIWLMWRIRLAYFMGSTADQLSAIYYPGIKPVKDPGIEHFYPRAVESNVTEEERPLS